MNKCLRIRKRDLNLYALLYLAIPVIIFYMGWLKLTFSLPLSIILSISIKCALSYKVDKDETIEIPIDILLLALVITVFWVYMSGIGGFVWQRPDWQARNATLHDLINYDWPVIYESGEGLSYYLCFWMIPALVGKLLGWHAANMTLFIWSILGLMLAELILLCYFAATCNEVRGVARKTAIVVLLVFVLWGGLNVVGQLMVFLKGKGTMDLNSIYGWSQFQYTPNNALLEWVFNQAVPSWLVAGLFMLERIMDQKKSVADYALLLMLLIPYSPFAALGFAPLLLADAVKFRFKGLFSISNILAVLATLPIFFAYYACNGALSGETGASGSLISLYLLDGKNLPYTLAVLIIFYTLEVGIYAILIWWRNRCDYMFLTTVVWLFFIPLIRIGPTRDFMLRGSIIPLFILMVYVVDALLDFGKPRHIYASLLLATLIGLYSGAGDFVLTTRNTADQNIRNIADDLGTMNITDNQEWIEYTAGSTYVAENADGTLFFGKLAKRPKTASILDKQANMYAKKYK